ncbi:MAG: hypothetical protein LUH43_03615 [Clostridia bacterium]|nr:hypothetical protein [Clostridia bacterium]
MYIGTNGKEEIHIPDEYSGIAFAVRDDKASVAATDAAPTEAADEAISEAERMFRRGYVFDRRESGETRGGEIRDVTAAFAPAAAAPETVASETVAPETASANVRGTRIPPPQKKSGGALDAVLGIIKDISTDEIIIAALIIMLFVNGGDDLLMLMLVILLFC